MPDPDNRHKILLAANCNVEPIVIRALERISKQEVELDFIDSIYLKSIHTFKRHITYIQVAWRVLRKRNSCSAIIFWQQFIALYYILFAKLTFARIFPPAIVLTFIFIKRDGIVGFLHKSLYNLAVHSPSIHHLVCHSSSEEKYYSNEFGKEAAHKFTFIPIGEGTYLFDEIEGAPEPYFFSGGTSNRDYATLIEAFRPLDDKLVIACRTQDVEGIDIPPNVEVRFDIYGNDFLKYQQQAKALIISIRNPNVSAGQLVLLNAMRAGKVSILTAGNCLDDYAEKEFTLKVKAQSPEDIREAVRFINQNPDPVKEMEAAALARYKESYSLERYGEKVAGLITTLI